MPALAQMCARCQAVVLLSRAITASYRDSGAGIAVALGAFGFDFSSKEAWA